MPRVLKKTLQARARRLGVKGFSKMTYAQLERAIATAKKKKPKRKTTAKKCITRRKPMSAPGSMRRPQRKQLQEDEDRFDLYKFRTDLEEEIQEEIEEGYYSFSDDLDIAISERIDNAVTYNYQSALICIACNFYDWTQSEFGQINTMREAAYAALNDYVYQDSDTYQKLKEFFEDNA